MFLTLWTRFDARRRSDEGSTLVSVLIIMLVLTIGGLMLSTVVVNTTTMLGASRDSAQSRAAADAGLADVITRAQRGEDVCLGGTYTGALPDYRVDVLCDSGRVTVRATGYGINGAATTTEAVYIRQMPVRKLSGAVLSKEGGISTSSLHLQSPTISGDVVLDRGDFNCNNTTRIEGDVVVRNGGIHLSNQCYIVGDLVASGHVQIDNNAVGVGGDVYAGSFYVTTAATVEGDVYSHGAVKLDSGGKVNGSVIAGGTFTIDNVSTRVGGTVWAAGKTEVRAATIIGAVVSSGPDNVSVENATIGGLRAAGPIVKIQSSRVKGDVSSSSSMTNEFRAGVVIDGSLTLASTWSPVAPTVGGQIDLNTPNIAPPAPTITRHWALEPDSFEWIDVSYNASDWGAYSAMTVPDCNMGGSWGAHHRAVIEARDVPTVVDARGCTNLNLYMGSFSIKTDIVFLVSAVQAQQMSITSFDGQPHSFHFIHPDQTADGQPSCPGPNPGSRELQIYQVTMAPEITGIVYTPCKANVGSNSGGRWNGLVYAGEVSLTGNSTPRMVLDYQPITIPGLDLSGGGAGGPTDPSRVGALISLRDL